MALLQGHWPICSTISYFIGLIQLSRPSSNLKRL
jgi:hypothetical protein